MAELAERALTMQVIHEGDLTRLVPSGDMDMDSAHTFEAVAEQVVLARPAAIELDMQGVEFLDSSGLRSIVQLRNRADVEGVALTVTGLTPAAQRVLELTGLISELRRG